MSIKRVAVYGGTGNLGPAIVNALVDAGFDVTVFSRNSKEQPGLSPAAKVQQLDFNDSKAITSALTGFDALISAVGMPGLSAQTQVFDAAIAAGVRHIIPSEFGSDTVSAKGSQLPIFGHKVEVRKYLEAKAAEGKVQYTLVMNSAFLDWGLDYGFFANLAGQNTPVYDGGDIPFSATLLSDVGKAVAGVLKNPDEYKNRAVKVHSAVVTQNGLLAATRKAGADTPTTEASTKDQYEQSYAALKTGKDIEKAMFGFLFVVMFDPSYGSEFPNADSEKLGLHRLSDAEVEALVAKVVKAKKAQQA